MKRSERIRMKARRAALWGLAGSSATVCAAVWSVRVWQEFASGGAAALILTLAGGFFCGGLLREAARLARMSRNEARWEWEREVRPRL